jgi:triosephosphate isomerase (TIM)
MRTPIFAANWKMNKLVKETSEYVQKLGPLLSDLPKKMGVDYEVVLAPAATHLSMLSGLLVNTSFRLGAQNCGFAKFGAYTGESSPVVLRELGCEWVIVGHSERRHVFKEDDALIVSRMKAAVEEGLNVIFCVGEILQDRKAGKTFNTLERQLSILKQQPLSPPSFSRLVIAYEPVWAIGTGENATPQQAQEVHLFIRNWFGEKFSRSEADALRILYGGSVKAENAGQIMGQKDVDGLLVGGASLDPAVFSGVIKNGLKV